MKIKDLNISEVAISTFESIGFTDVSELAGYNYLSLIDKFPGKISLVSIVDELNAIGYLIPPNNEICVRDVPMKTMLKNALLRNGVLYLSQLSSYSKEDILRFKNLGKVSFIELDQICQKYGIEIRTQSSIKD